MVALSQLQPVGGTKVKLFNRGKPKAKPITQRDLKRLQSVVGEIVSGKWQAVVDGTAYVVRVSQ